MTTPEKNKLVHETPGFSTEKKLIVCETDPPFVSTHVNESTVLLAAGYAGVLLSESPWRMKFPAAARTVAEKRERRRQRAFYARQTQHPLE